MENRQVWPRWGGAPWRRGSLRTEKALDGGNRGLGAEEGGWERPGHLSEPLPPWSRVSCAEGSFSWHPGLLCSGTVGKKSTCPTPGSFSAKHSHAVSSWIHVISLTVLLCGCGKLASSLCTSTSALAERRNTNDNTSQIELKQSSTQKVDQQLGTAFATRRGCKCIRCIHRGAPSV